MEPYFHAYWPFLYFTRNNKNMLLIESSSENIKNSWREKQMSTLFVDDLNFLLKANKIEKNPSRWFAGSLQEIA